MLYMYTMRAGWNLRTACVALVHAKLLRLSGAALAGGGGGGGAGESLLRVHCVAVPEAMRARRANIGGDGGKADRSLSSGKAVNLISTDVMKFDSYLPNMHYIWAGPLECLAIIALVWAQVGAPPNRPTTKPPRPADRQPPRRSADRRALLLLWVQVGAVTAAKPPY
jgi:hypothetical protein